MKVSVFVLDQHVLVAPAAKADGRSAAGLKMATVRPQQRLGQLSYDELRELGDGHHEVQLNRGDFAVCGNAMQTPAPSAPAPISGRWVLGLVVTLLAAVSFFAFWAVAQVAESVGVHPAVTGAYWWGGIVAVPSLLAGGGCLLLGAAVLGLLARRRT